MDQPPPPTPPGDPHVTARPAGLGVRLAARVLDAVLVGLPLSALLALAGLPAPTLALGGVEAWTHGAITSLVWLAYYAGCESLFGTTLGKRIVGLRVVAEHGEVPGPVAATVRNLWLLAGLIPWVGGLVLIVVVIVIATSIARHPHHLGRHDEAAGTSVHVVTVAAA
jgi:uncharacterized RDD family membrane protein YckC